MKRGTRFAPDIPLRTLWINRYTTKGLDKATKMLRYRETPRALFARIPMLFRRERKAVEADGKVLERLETLERHQRMMQLEWADTLDLLKRQMHRVIKERQRAEAALPEEPESQPEAAVDQGLPQLDPISQRILARRNRLSHRQVEQ